VLAPANRNRLNEWVTVANLPFDEDNYLESVELSVKDALRFSIVNLQDAAVTLGGFPFDNSTRVYRGSSHDLLLNLSVPRATAAPAAVAAMNTSYRTTGVLERPLITLHTLLDQQVPYVHQQLYSRKTRASGSLLTRHLPISIDRFGHCNFTPDEVLASFAIMLFYDGVVENASGFGSFLSPEQLASFEARVAAAGVPASRAGAAPR
jgi:hypothetical protein